MLIFYFQKFWKTELNTALLAPNSFVLVGAPAAAGRPLHCPDLPSSMAADRISLTGNAQAQVNMRENGAENLPIMEGG